MQAIETDNFDFDCYLVAEMIIRRFDVLEHPVIARNGNDGETAWKVIESLAYPYPIRIHIALYAIHRLRTLRTYPGVSRFLGIPPARLTAPGPAL